MAESWLHADDCPECDGARYGPVAADTWSRPWFLFSSVGLLDLLLLASVRILRARGYVAVHKRGIELRLGSLRTRSLRWTEISGLVYGATQERLLWLARSPRLPLWRSRR